MFKLKKQLMSLVIAGVTISGATGLSFASENESINPIYIPKEGWVYTNNAKSSSVKIDWTHTHSNPSSTTDYVTKTVSRTKSSTGTFGAESNFKVLQQQVGFNAEVALGKSSSVSTSIQYSIPAYTTYQLRYGSKVMKASGTEKYYENGTVTKSRTSSATYTYESYSDKVKK